MPSGLSALNSAFDHIYVLTLDRARERQEHIASELEGLDFEFFTGVDKFDLDYDATIADGVYDDDKHHRLQRSSRSLSLGEVACALSHRGIYEDAVERGYETILVLEDDVAFLRQNLPVFEAAWAELPADWEFLLLGYYDERYSTPFYECKRLYYQACRRLGLFHWERVSRRFINHQAMRPYSEHWWRMGRTSGGHAYALTQSACRRFVDYHTPVFLQADRVFYYYAMDRDLNAYALKEQLFVPSELARDSGIGYATSVEKAAERGKKFIQGLGS